jgi:invasion protein IalB
MPAIALIRITALAAAFAAAGWAGAALAASPPKAIGAFGDWSAWEIVDGKNRICYIATKPKSSEDKGLKRSTVQIQISSRTADKVKNEVGVYVGYPIKPDSKVTATVDTDAFELTPSTQKGYRETAWIHDTARERQFVEAMMKGKTLKVSATPEKGNATTDTYSLSGVTAALKAIGDRCK